MSYKENPKTKGSGILCCIPQKTLCPYKCEDCFFQSGRSYLEPLEENIPNMPEISDTVNHVVRVNDGNDSSIDRQTVLSLTKNYVMRFYNTSSPICLEGYEMPVVLTLNTGSMTDMNFLRLTDPLPKNLMFVRIRVNTWNLSIVDQAINYYTKREIPIVLTFMRYYKEIESIEHKNKYKYCKHILNSYWMLLDEERQKIIRKYINNHLVYECGETLCKSCGNCLREYFVTMERIKGSI